MKSLFNEAAFTEIKSRLDALNENSERQWGKMDAAQMMNHCQEPLRIPLGKSTMKKPGFLLRLMAKMYKGAMYGDKPWKKNLRTAPGFAVTDPKEFRSEKEKLSALIDEFHQMKSRETMPDHPAFGTFSKEQWGKMHYKHLDHHFRQFGV